MKTLAATARETARTSKDFLIKTSSKLPITEQRREEKEKNE